MSIRSTKPLQLSPIESEWRRPRGINPGTAIVLLLGIGATSFVCFFAVANMMLPDPLPQARLSPAAASAYPDDILTQSINGDAVPAALPETVDTPAVAVEQNPQRPRRHQAHRPRRGQTTETPEQEDTPRTRLQNLNLDSLDPLDGIEDEDDDSISG